MAPTAEPTISAAIIGGSGFVGAELLRWLTAHPNVRVEGVTSRRHRGHAVESVHRGLSPTGLRFENAEPAEIAARAEVVFVATPTDASAEIVHALTHYEGRVLDLSGAYRLRDAAEFERAYGYAHPHPSSLGAFAYGLPELGVELYEARRISVPGCFATAVALSAYPVWRSAPSVPERVRVVGVTGSTGSGGTPSARTHHPIRSTNLAPYRPLSHQHAPEIEAALASVRAREFGAGSPLVVDFVPVSAPLSRGIVTTTFIDLPEGLTDSGVDAWFAAAYENCPFVRRFGADGRMVEVAAVKGSMFVELSWARSACGRTLVVNAALDNLAKGGAGQAVQCMNLMWGLPEDRGLGRPALWP